MEVESLGVWVIWGEWKEDAQWMGFLVSVVGRRCELQSCLFCVDRIDLRCFFIKIYTQLVDVIAFGI